MQYLNRKFSIPAPSPPLSQFKMVECGNCKERFAQVDLLAPQFSGANCGMCRESSSLKVTEARIWQEYYLACLMSG